MSEPDIPYPKKRNEPVTCPPHGILKKPLTNPDLTPGQPPNLTPVQAKRKEEDKNKEI
jgi:hypothetical protein